MPPAPPETIRPPAVAGQFYPADPQHCRALAASYLQSPHSTPPQTCLGGIVPHAGWICSGAIAGQTISTIARQTTPDIVVIFGAIHTPIPTTLAALDTHSLWQVPTGQSPLSTELESKLLESPNLFTRDPRLHQREHAIEVELPLIQLAFPSATILPIEIPPDDQSTTIGRQTARQLQKSNLKPIFLASSDLTHYGPNYRFTPAGLGPPALDWAMQNDQRLLELVMQLAADKIVPEVRSRFNACGAGAIAAMLAACHEYGATSATVITHANSCQTLAQIAPQPPTNAVGYASVVVA
jgi:AmmeMemoRadiSam system protein B